MELGYDRSLDHQDRLRVATFIQDILIGKNKKYDEQVKADRLEFKKDNCKLAYDFTDKHEEMLNSIKNFEKRFKIYDIVNKTDEKSESESERKDYSDFQIDLHGGLRKLEAIEIFKTEFRKIRDKLYNGQI